MAADGGWEAFFVGLLEEHRVPLLTLCLPIAFCYGVWSRIKQKAIRWLVAKEDSHEERVARISTVLEERAALPASQRKRIVTDRNPADQLQLTWYGVSLSQAACLPWLIVCSAMRPQARQEQVHTRPRLLSEQDPEPEQGSTHCDRRA